MVDTLLAVVAVAVVVTVGFAALFGVTVAPLLVALDRAERLRVSPARLGVGAVAGCAAGLLLALAAVRSGLGSAAVVPLVVTWAVPVLVTWVPGSTRLAGRAGRHERALR